MKKILENCLRFFAKRIIKKYQPKIIGITGSVGKSSTKEAIFAVLKTKFRTRASSGNYNNEIGLPLSIIGAPSGNKSFFKWLGIFWAAKKLLIKRNKNYPDVLVLEMGADKKGDIKYLTEIARPNIGVVTAIAPVHVEFFGSLEGIIKEKQILINSLPADGAAVLNYDDKNVLNMSKAAKCRFMTFGFEDGADVKALEFSSNLRNENGVIDGGVSFKVSFSGSTVPVYLSGVLGRQHIYSAIAAMAVGTSFGMNLVETAEALKNYKAPPGRMNIISGIKQTVLIDDTYNSSPLATLAALDALRDVNIGERAKRIAVLGDMLELGDFTEEGHRAVGRRLAENHLDFLITVGERARFIAEEAKKMGMEEGKVASFDFAEEAGRYLQDLMEKGDVILIKGSQGMRMEKVTKEVMAEPLRAKELLVRQDEAWEKK
ncbi:MAG: UDP-N-acetylmuramoyl-tripeptide--D-alanyl-D-alanine ligase [Patescibacteria group bacterium]|nr:UDP-N-acetylmuramoyl-tripeptide--D-alanyl-D-alanine ligase [Patescibacteria group bacterium]MDD5490587.1 UDP-N-acetylmuramoyl-tripeptide--D-alanyl-D-alanine ligase [Patescibacteria group bacterium]